ncbi:MAG TPA: aspartate--tRNA ligase [Actinomycetota bacterium]|nr:aspartate--tRNA ligase [Actinomycetota bacterium]
MSIFATSMRTDACGELRAGDVGRTVRLCGWVAHQRDHGGVTFVDLRDREGLVQLVFHPEQSPAAHEIAQRFKTESVVVVSGDVRARPEGTVNPNLPTGEVEVVVSDVTILSAAETPPFPIEDRIEADELLRLRYRYLDLRRPEMSRMLRMRDRVTRVMRTHMDGLRFVDVETPALTRSTPEGARDFLVPSRIWPGSFYALPQSPQQLKQLLMVAGQDRYYQIVRCFRDENPRADRTVEFTQLDVEMSFVDEEDVFAVIEPLYARIVSELVGADVPMPFPRLTYDEMMARFGSDKPDLRYGMELVDLEPVFASTEFRAFASALEAGGVIKGFAAPGGGSLSRKELDELVQQTKGRGAAGLVWGVVEGAGIRSPVEKFLSSEEVEALRKATGAGPGDLILIVADREDRANVALDGLRRDLAARLDLVPEGEWRFCWMVEPPLFEWSDDEDKWVSVHHPFTAPIGEDLDPAMARGRAYDLVLNGFEIGGGSIRIHRPDVQDRVFQILGLSHEQIEEQFGHLLRAFRYGVPPHGGIAMGLDRIVMLLTGTESLRDVTAFPKAQSGQDPLTGAPAPATQEQLRELGLRLAAPPKAPPVAEGAISPPADLTEPHR